MPREDTETINSFLSEFVGQVTAAFPKEIEYIILTGSAARGDFCVGESDIDLGISVKNKNDIEKVEKTALGVFWKLDDRHATGFRDIYRRKGTGRPLSVHGPGGRPRKKDLFSSLEFIHGFHKQLTRHTHRTAKILYGSNDHLRRVAQREAQLHNPYDILIHYDILLSLSLVPACFFFPDQCLKRSIRCLLFTFEDNMAGPNAVEAVNAKKNFNKIKKEWSYLHKIAYCIKAPFLIMYDNIQRLFAYYQKKAW